MRALLTAVLLLLGAAPAAAADVQRVGGGLPRYADGAISEDGSAIAYETRRGIVLRRLGADGRFGRPRLVASRARGGRVNVMISVATRGRRAVVGWLRVDGSEKADPDLRKEGCCDRIHAVVVRGSGRAGRPKRVSPPGQSALLGPLVVGPRTEVVTWDPECCRWMARVHTRRGWLRGRSLSSGTPGDLRYVGRRLLAVAVEEVRSTIRVIRRVVGARGGTSSPRRVATFRGLFSDLSLRLDDSGGTTGAIQVDDEDRLIAGGRARRLGLRRDEDLSSATAASGASAVLALPYERTVARIWTRPPRAGAFGPWRKVRLADRRRTNVDSIRLQTRDDGRVAVVTAFSSGRRTVVAVADAFGGFRRVRTYRRAKLEGTTFDRLGRLTLLVRGGRRMEVVRP